LAATEDLFQPCTASQLLREGNSGLVVAAAAAAAATTDVIVASDFSAVRIPSCISGFSGLCGTRRITTAVVNVGAVSGARGTISSPYGMMRREPVEAESLDAR
jgi:hypothetical protein